VPARGDLRTALQARYGDWRYEWERQLLDATRRAPFRNTFEDIETIARRNLQDRLAWIAAKAATRAAAKGVVTHQLFQEEEWVGALLGTLFTLLTEQADLRSWLTLPRDIQWLRRPLEPGVYDFGIELVGPGGKVVEHSDLGRYELRPGERVICNVRSVNRSSFSYLGGGRKVEPIREVRE